MTEEQFLEKFHNMYMARYPIIAIDTHEETWLTKVLVTYCNNRSREEGKGRRPRRVVTWDRAIGYTDPDMVSKPELEINVCEDNPNQKELHVNHEQGAQIRNLHQRLDFLYQYVSAKDVRQTIFVIYDLEEDINNVVVQRYLKRIAQKIRHTSHALILVQGHIQIPPILEREITMLEFCTPAKPFFEQRLERMLVKNKETVADSLSEEDRERLFASLFGLSGDQVEHLLGYAILENNCSLDAKMLEIVKKKKREEIRKSGLLEDIDTSERLRDVGGLDNLKAYLDECKLTFGASAESYGIKPPKGFLTVGPPGAGKTMIAKAAANALGLPLIRFDVARVFSHFVGSSEKNIRYVQRELERYAPCVVLMDEIDKAIAGLKGGGGDSGTGSRVLGSLLTFMNDTQAPIFFVGTANSIDLPPEILRKGRWDEIFSVNLPQTSEREQIFKIHLRKARRKAANYDIERLAKKTPGFSGAEIANVVQQGLRKAFHEGAEDMADSHMFAAIKETKPLSKTMAAQIDQIIAFSKDRTRPASSAAEEFSSKTKINNTSTINLTSEDD